MASEIPSMISADVKTSADRFPIKPAGLTASEAVKRVFVHYWGSYFKSLRQVRDLGLRFRVLVENGWQCHLVLERLPDEGSWLNELHELGVMVDCIKRPKSNFDRSAIRQIRDYCTETRCHTFLCDNIHMSPLIGAAWAGVPSRFWSKRAMNSYFEQCRAPSLKERIAISTRLSGWLSTKVLAVSRSVADELESSGVPRKKILVQPNPRPEMSLIHRSREEIRTELGYTEGDIILISIGRMEKVKGWDLLVDAFLQQACNHPNVRLLLVGSCNIKGQEDFRRDVERMIDRSDHRERIRFQGHQQDVQSMLLAG
ncbi:MAG: glycosyltransferase, partial [Proteobacteria bacterium]